MTAGHITALTQRERDILIEYNDGTYQTTLQPAAEIERVAAEVYARAARDAHDRATLSEGAGHIETAANWRARAAQINPAPRVQMPGERIAAE